MRLTKSLLLLALTASVGVSAAAAQDATPVNVDIGLTALLEDGAVVESQFEGLSAAHLYGFYGSEGDVVNISMTHGEESYLDPLLVLIGPQGQVVAANDDMRDEDDELIGLDSLIEGVELPVDGPYLIMASSYSYMRSEVEDELLPEDNGYTLTLEGPTAPELTDETVVAGTVVTTGTEVEGELTWENPVSIFFLEGSAGDVVNLTMESDDTDPILYVFAPSGVRVAVNDDADLENSILNSSIEELELPEDGTYLILGTNAFFYSAPQGEEESMFSGGEFTFKVE
jgi:hypothetical protein